MRLFYLDRVVDASGVSGTGQIAQGVIFDDGSCALRWLTNHTSTAIYASIGDVVSIHGHDGKTKVVQFADVNAEEANHLRMNAIQDDMENIACDFREGNAKYMWDQREKLVAMFNRANITEGAIQ